MIRVTSEPSSETGGSGCSEVSRRGTDPTRAKLVFGDVGPCEAGAGPWGVSRECTSWG